MEYSVYKTKYDKLEACKLRNPDLLAQYRTDTAAAIALMEALPPTMVHKSYYENGQRTDASICLETGELLGLKTLKNQKVLANFGSNKISPKQLFWELDSDRLIVERNNAAPAPKPTNSTKLIENKVRVLIEQHTSIKDWIDAQPEVDNILVGAAHLNTKTELTSFDKPLNRGDLFHVLQQCDTISTYNTMALLNIGKSQAERINAAVRVAHTAILRTA